MKMWLRHKFTNTWKNSAYETTHTSISSTVRNADCHALSWCQVATWGAIGERSGLSGLWGMFSVLPYDVGRELGFIWDIQTIPLRLTGVLQGAEAYLIAMKDIVSPCWSRLRLGKTTSFNNSGDSWAGQFFQKVSRQFRWSSGNLWGEASSIR
jgi:hypothetical protein